MNNPLALWAIIASFAMIFGISLITWMSMCEKLNFTNNSYTSEMDCPLVDKKIA